MMALAGRIARGMEAGRGRLHSHRIIFHHIPKCGGSAVTRPLRLRSVASFTKIDEDAALDAATGDTWTERHEAAFAFKTALCRYEAARGRALIQGHFPWFPTADGPAGSYDRITVLREPVARFLSHFHWDHGRENANRIEGDLAAFLDTDQAAGFGTMLTRFLGGVPWPLVDADAAVARAKDNAATFRVVGFLEDLPAFAAAMGRAYGWRLAIPHSNAGRVADPGRGLPEDLMERVRKLCAPDTALYDVLRGKGP